MRETIAFDIAILFYLDLAYVVLMDGVRDFDPRGELLNY